jgi:hypothetical protein
MQKVVENLEKKVIYSVLSTWASDYKPNDKYYIVPKIKEKCLTSNWSDTNKGYNVYTKNTKIYVSLATSNYSNEYLFVQVSCVHFHLGFWWYPNSHSITRIIDWETDGFEDFVYEVKKDEKNTYDVDYNTVIKFINIVCRPPSRTDSPLFKQLATHIPSSYDLLFIILNYLYVSLV